MTTADALRAVLDGRWAEVRDRVRSEVPPEWYSPPVRELTIEEHRARTLERLQVLAGFDYAGLGLPAELGGAGDLGAQLTAFEVLGHADLSLFVKTGVQFGLFGGAIAGLGTRAHHERYLGPALDASLPGCFAMTETGHGSDVQSLETTATYDPATDELVIATPGPSARKDYIGGAARDARVAAVFAQLVVGGEDHGVHCVLVPVRDGSGEPCPGVTIEDCGPKAGLRGVDNGRLSFDGVRVPRSALLDRYGSIDDEGRYTSPIENPSRRFFTMLGTLVRGRVSVAAGAGAATRSALTLAVRYALHRRQFRAPGTGEEVALLDYGTHQRRLLPALATSYALALAQNRLVERLDVVTRGEADDTAQRELEARAAGLKAVTTAHATATIQACREACGGAGYLSVNRLADLKADTDVFTTFEGDNTVLLQLVAKGMLTNYAEAFHELDALGTVRFGARVLIEAVVERTVGGATLQRLVAAAPGRDSPQALRDRGTLLGLVEDRERHLTETLAARLRGRESEDPLTTLTQTQDHLVEAARAHVDRVVLEAFVSAVEDVGGGGGRGGDGPGGDARDGDGAGDVGPSAAGLLARVCDLHALSTVEAHCAWYLEHGRLTPGRSKQVHALVAQACADLRPHAATLVDAFGIPDPWLATEMLGDTDPVDAGAAAGGVGVGPERRSA